MGGAAAAAEALAARPSGLAAEKPGFVAEACWLSQFSERATVLPAVEWVPFWATLSLRWPTTRHFSLGSRSPTVTATVALKPELLKAAEASPYVWPVTLGAASATPADINTIDDVSAAVLAIRTIKLCIASTNFLCRFERRFHHRVDAVRPSTRLKCAPSCLKER